MASTATTQSPLLVPRGALEGKPPIPISRPVWIIGSRKGCHLHLVSEHVSQAHAVIINTGRGLFIKDLASRTHTYVNRLPVKEVQLSDGDKVQIGTFKFYFRDPTANPGDRPPVAPAAVLRVKGERIPVPLDLRVTLIGRRSSADIPLTEESVSTTHALIIDIDGEHYVRDLGSRTGTYINGQKINRQAPLSPGDVIRIGDTELAFDTIVGQAIEGEEESSGDSAIAVSLSESSAPIEPAGIEPAEIEPVAVEPQAEMPAEAPAEDDLALPLSFEELMTPAEPADATPAAPEVSATAMPLADEEPPLSIAPEPVAEAEPVVEPPAKGVRRGWRQWGTRQPGQAKAPQAEAPKAEPEPPVASEAEPPVASEAEPPVASEAEPPVASEAEPLALSEPLELSEIPASEPAGVDLTPLDEAPAPPTVDLSADESAPAELEPEPVEQIDELAPAPEPEPADASAEEPALALEPLDADATDTAYGVDAAAGPSSDDAAAAREEVTAGELELSAVDEPHELELEASTEESSVATETEPSVDEVFKGVDLEALSLDALNEPESAAESPAEPSAEAEEVSATLDLAAAAEPEAVEPELVPPPSLDLVEPEAPGAPVEEVTPELELPTKVDEDALESEPLTMADDGAPASERVEPPAASPVEPPVASPVEPPAASPVEPAKSADDLPPPLATPVRLRPSTRRRKRGGDEEQPPPRRRGPVRGPGGKFLSAAEAEKLAREQEASFTGESETDALSEVEAPEQSATSDVSDEVLEPTEPTPESALSLEPVTPPATDELPLPAEEPVPSDSVFGRTVEEMAGGAGTGDLIDDPAGRPMSPLEQIAADATHFVETDAHHEVEVEPTGEAPEIIEHEDEPAADDVAIDETASDEAVAEAPADVDPASELPLELPAVDEEPLPEAAAVEPETPLDLPAVDEEPAAEVAPEPLPELDLAATAELPLETEATQDALSIEPPAELSFDETFEPTEATSLAGDAAPAEPSATVSEAAEPAPLEPQQQPQPPMGPAGLGFFGIVRDADTFLGGMPLSLPPLPPPPPTFGKVGVAFEQGEKGNPHAAPPPPPLMIGDEDDEPVAEAPGSSNEQTATGLPVDDSGANDTTIITPASDTGVTTGPARMPVPPRPRRNRLADYEKRFAKVDEDAALEAMLREQNKGQPESSSTATGFDGLTLGTAVRQTDVFSDAPSAPIPVAESGNDPFLADKQASIDLAARTVETGRIPPAAGAATGLSTPTNGSDPFGPPSIPTAAIAERAPERPIGERARPPRQSLPAPSPDFNYTGPRRGPRWISIRVLVAAMVLFMLAAGVAGFMLTPVYTTLLAKVSFANLKDRSEFEKHKFRTEQQTVLTSEVVRNQARAKLAEEAPALEPGLLADPLAFDELARHLEWPAGTNDMRLELKSVDPAGDRQRLAALLHALYSENKHLLDVAAEKRAEFDKAQQELDALNAQLKALIIRIREANDSLSDAPSASLIAQVEQEAGQLADAWQAAVANVRQLKFDLERLAPAGMEPGAAQPVEAAVGEVVGGDPDKDPVVVAAREELKALQADIARLKALSAEDAADKARKALEASVATYQAELAKLQDGKGAEWQDFLGKAKKLQGMALQMTGDLINRQREVQEKLAEMKSKLEQELVEQREKIYRDDPKLKELNDKFRLATRQYNVASAEPSLAAEAARWKEDIERQQAAIAQRRAELPDDPEVVKRIAEVQRLIDEGRRSIASDRRTLDVQMADTLKEFLGTGSALYQKLNDGDKAAAQSLADRASDMVKAHETYGQVVNSIKSGDSEELRKKEASAQQLAATIDHRIAEVRDAERKNKGELERQAALQQIEEARTKLAAAEKDELAARDLWLAKQKELADLKNKALIAKAADDKLQENQRARQAMEAQINAKVRELDEKRKTGVATITPEEVAPDAITTGPTEDGRWKYALVSSMAVCGVFLVLIWLGGYHQTPTSGGGHRPAIETVAGAKPPGTGDEDTVAV